MAENEDGQEKSQEPTGKRLDEARKKGQVPRSRELNTMALTIIGVPSVMLMGGHFSSGFESQFREHLMLSRQDIFDPNALLAHLVGALREALIMLLPFFGIMIVVAVAASVALGGFNISAEAMQPKFSKLDPIKGVKRLFGPKGLMELLKSLAKFVLVGSVTVSLLWAWQDDILGLADMDVTEALSDGLSMVGWASLLISSTMVLMAAIDVPFQLWQHKKELKMTQQEVRDELKQTEGRPEVKGRIRQLQREMAQRRMMEEAPKADVIVTNPTHYAVALRYDPDTMASPIVVAKGKDLVAANIREVGAEHEVPLIEAPVLARAIYFNTELNDTIPAGLFPAVAQLLAYVFQLRAWKLEVGYRLIPLVDRSQGEQLMNRIEGVRKKLSQELGFLVQAVHIRDNLDLSPNAYRISLNCVPLGEAEIYPDRDLAINPGKVYGELQGTPTTDPAFGLEAVWIDPGQRDHAQTLGYTVVDASTVVATHLSELLQRHAAELLGHEEVQQLLDNLAQSAPKLVEDLVPKLLPLTTITRVLQNLLEEGVSIRDIRTIAETLAEQAPMSQDVVTLTGAVRVALNRAIVQQLVGSIEEIPVIVLEPGLERLLQQALASGGGDSAGIEPGLLEQIQVALGDAARQQELSGQEPILLVAAGVRPWMARFVRQGISSMHVLSYNEILDNRQIKVINTIGRNPTQN